MRLTEINKVLSVIFIISALIGTIFFFVSLLSIFRGDTDGLIYLWTIPPLVYFIFFLTKLIKDNEFEKKHKLTSHLFIWPASLTIVMFIITFISALFAGTDAGLAMLAVVLFTIAGTVLTFVLSAVGLIIDYFRNK